MTIGAGDQVSLLNKPYQIPRLAIASPRAGPKFDGAAVARVTHGESSPREARLNEAVHV